MNLPNKLTILRVIMIPFFVLFMLLEGGLNPLYRYIAAAIFIVASFTDWLDGNIARKYGLVTNFGKFMDPLADKLLVCSGLICFTGLGQLSAWIVILIISREFIISGFRLVASDNGVVIAASYWGKLKTVSQMIMSVLLILNIPMLSFVTVIFIWIATALTLISLVDYIVKNYKVLQKGACNHGCGTDFSWNRAFTGKYCKYQHSVSGGKMRSFRTFYVSSGDGGGQQGASFRRIF